MLDLSLIAEQLINPILCSLQVATDLSVSLKPYAFAFTIKLKLSSHTPSAALTGVLVTEQNPTKVHTVTKSRIRTLVGETPGQDLSQSASAAATVLLGQRSTGG
ncbi:unnamed protein product [Cuscuta epithymum]|uniref:Uncharacterized protein n=1 Tax=Cuscuta epithymum TaxID=186058 RepID=A0AAV0DU30_9ASTE|nr:unnamed protein product [Cuscuta epithymum]